MESIKTDTEIAVINEKLPSLQNKVEALVVKDEPSSRLMTDYCGFIKDAINKVEEKRKFYVGPMNEAVKRLNNDAKAITAPLSELLRIGKDKIMSYLEAAREKERKEAEEKQKKLDEMAKKNGLPEVKVEVEEKRQVKSAIGHSFTHKIWKWRIIKEEDIPKEYWIIDEKKINGIMRANIRTVRGESFCDVNISGIEFYQEENIAIRT